jgi:hypothetical protein
MEKADYLPLLIGSGTKSDYLLPLLDKGQASIG